MVCFLCLTGSESSSFLGFGGLASGDKGPSPSPSFFLLTTLTLGAGDLLAIFLSTVGVLAFSGVVVVTSMGTGLLTWGDARPLLELRARLVDLARRLTVSTTAGDPVSS